MSPGDLLIVARNTVRVLLDSNRLRDIQQVGEILGRESMVRAADRLRRTEDGWRILTSKPELNSSQVDFAALAELPTGTVGRHFSDHLQRHGLDPDALSVPARTDDESEHVYVLRRYRGNHDIWHALLGLGTTGHEEVLVHAFSYGQLRFPLSALVVLFGTAKHFVLERRWQELKTRIARAYRAGRDAEFLLAVHWEERWAEPLSQMRHVLRVPDGI